MSKSLKDDCQAPDDSFALRTVPADIVDNSIPAGAGRVRIDFHWDDDASVISVTDVVSAMAADARIAEMRSGSQNHPQDRAPQDLERFLRELKPVRPPECRRVRVRALPLFENSPVVAGTFIALSVSTDGSGFVARFGWALTGAEKPAKNGRMLNRPCKLFDGGIEGSHGLEPGLPVARRVVSRRT